MAKLSQSQISNGVRMAQARESHMCYLIRQWLRENQFPSAEITDDVILKRLRHPYETDRRAKQQLKRMPHGR